MIRPIQRVDPSGVVGSGIIHDDDFEPVAVMLGAQRIEHGLEAVPDVVGRDHDVIRTPAVI